ncbi:MAG: hypothetical protein V3V01_13000 [Acidimicrobiales bacterium]
MKRLTSVLLTLAIVAGACSTSSDLSGSGSSSSTSDLAATSEPTPATSTTSTSPAKIEATTTAPTTTVAITLVETEIREATPDTPAGFTVAYYGDSLAASAEEAVRTFLTQGGRLNFVPGTFPGSALCDWWPQIARDRAAHEMWAVVLFFTNNTFSPCMKNADGSELTAEETVVKFRSDLELAIELFKSEGATIYLPTIPESRGELVLGIQPSADLNALFGELAGADEAVFLVDAAKAVLSPEGRFTETLPCLANEPCTGGIDENGVAVNLVREPDGVHFCSGGYGEGVPIEVGTCPTWSSGAFRYAGALTSPIVAAAQAEWVAENPPGNVPNLADIKAQAGVAD